jgi:hypothetical protein
MARVPAQQDIADVEDDFGRLANGQIDPPLDGFDGF